mmetsp:Transcript_40573/g.106579  ORF Transcript_40573/g.106579 Transcript_40573/m.106579 type:complete len:225 (-) Transcript_40573:1044-1718(-)
MIALTWAGRAPATATLKNCFSRPARSLRDSLAASSRTSATFFAVSLNCFCTHPLDRSSSRSNIFSFTRVLYWSSWRRSLSRRIRKSIMSLPCGVESRVWPMDLTSSQTQSIKCSSGLSLFFPKTNSFKTEFTTFTDSNPLRYKFPMNFMFARNFFFCCAISRSKSSLTVNLRRCSSLGSIVLGSRSYSSCTWFNNILVNVRAGSPSRSGGNSGYLLRSESTMSA